MGIGSPRLCSRKDQGPSSCEFLWQPRQNGLSVHRSEKEGISYTYLHPAPLHGSVPASHVLHPPHDTSEPFSLRWFRLQHDVTHPGNPKGDNPLTPQQPLQPRAFPERHPFAVDNQGKSAGIRNGLTMATLQPSSSQDHLHEHGPQPS